MELLIVYILACIVIGLFTNTTTLGFWSGFLLSVLLSPVIGFIIFLFYPAKKKNTVVKDISSVQEQLNKLEEMKPQITEKEYYFLRKQIIG